MAYKDIFALCSNIRAKHIGILHGQILENFLC